MPDQIQRGNPAWRPGVSGNPSGRPKGAAGLARYISEQTNDGRELIDRLLAISRNPGAPIREVAAATQALLDRQIGKPIAPSVVNAHVETSNSASDRFRHLSLERKRAMLAELRGTRVQDPKVLDGDAALSPTAVALSVAITDEE